MYWIAQVKKRDGRNVYFNQVTEPHTLIDWLNNRSSIDYVTVYFYQLRDRKDERGAYRGYYSKKSGWSFMPL